METAKAHEEEAADNLRRAMQRQREIVASQFQAEVRFWALSAKHQNACRVAQEFLGKSVDASMRKSGREQIVFGPTRSKKVPGDQMNPDATDTKSIADFVVKTRAEQTPQMHIAGSKESEEFYIIVIEEPQMSYIDDDLSVQRGMRKMPDVPLYLDNNADFDDGDIEADLWLEYWGN
ncbi:hypothetical protein BZA77DRAFT_348582 [Pyronema omphalodes]|nr:hypothetical protein BZA77DRAFT_348582 [Pyronema omphalodes]